MTLVGHWDRGVPADRMRLVTATARPAIGATSHGNRYSGNTAPEVRYDSGAASPGGFYGLRRAAEPYRGPRRKARPALRTGAVCPGCGLERPLVGKCNSCW